MECVFMKEFKNLNVGDKFILVAAILQNGEPGAELRIKIRDGEDNNAVGITNGNLTRVSEKESVIKIL